MNLLPGVAERLAERSRRRPTRLDPVPIDLHRASAIPRYVRSGDEAEALLGELRSISLTAVALEATYVLARPGVPLRSGREWRDIRSQRPVCVSLAAWAQDGLEGGFVLRAVLDARDGAVVAVLGEVLRLRVPWIFHRVKDNLFGLWALGLDPDLHQLYDTAVTAAAIDLGLDHKRARKAPRDESEFEAIRGEQELEERREHHLSLAGQCERYGLLYPFSDPREELHGAPDLPLSPGVVERVAADAEWILRLHAAQQPEILRRALATHLFTVEFPFAVACARMEWRGVHVEQEHLARLREGALRARGHYAEELRRLGIDPPGSRDRFLALMRRAGLGELFRRRGKPSVDDRVLRQAEGRHPAVRAFRLHRHYGRLANDEWVRGVLLGADCRTHPTFDQLGSATGRIACSRPNLAGLDRILRPVVTAPPGRALVELDYSQIEVAVAAAEHRDAELLDAYNAGDVYAAVAQRFYAEELTQEERDLAPAQFKARRPELREHIKTFVLAVIYNIQAKGIAAQFGISVRDAERRRERFISMYPVLRRGLEESGTYGAVRGHASMVSGLRRRRQRREPADNWTRNYLRNTPIQGSATVVFKKALIDLDRAFRGSNTWLVLPVHDAVLIECDICDLDQVAVRARRIMEEAFVAYYPDLRPRVEVNTAAPWCWNKDGRADSLERFLADPTFRLDPPPLKRETEIAGFEERFLRVAGIGRGDEGADIFLDLVADLVERADERAAIYEVDTGLDREAAEERAGAETETLLRQDLLLAGLGCAAMEVAQ